MATGHGWVSDDSSFYGSDNEQEHQKSLCENINSQSFLSANDKSPNALRVAARKQRVDNAAAAPTGSRASALEQIVETSNASPFSMSGAVRKAMEQERLARHSKLKRTALPEPQPTPELFNFRQGSHDAWQLGETSDDFVNRLPPETTPISTCPWIWVENPSRHRQDKFAPPSLNTSWTLAWDSFNSPYRIEKRSRPMERVLPKACSPSNLFKTAGISSSV